MFVLDAAPSVDDLKGELKEASEDEIVISQTKKNKKQKNKVTEETVRFDPKDIKEAKVVITF